MFDSQQNVTQLRQELQDTQLKVQALRAELYRRRGQSAPSSEPQVSIQHGESDESLKLQEALDQARKEAQIYEAEIRRINPMNFVTMYSSTYAYFFGFINITVDLFNFGILSLLVLVQWKKLE